MSENSTPAHTAAVVGEPEVVEDEFLSQASPATRANRALVETAAWQNLKRAATRLQELQLRDGSIGEAGDVSHHSEAARLVQTLRDSIRELAPSFEHDADYLRLVDLDFERWADGGFGVPDFLDSLRAFQPQQNRVDGLAHLVVFPMYTQNGSTNRFVEAVLVETIWPEFVHDLEAGDYENKLFVPIRFLDFTPGYDTNSAVLFPETVAMREVPTFTWGAIFADREAARFRRVVTEAASITRLDLPDEAAALLADQQLAEHTFVMWDLIHDRTHMRGDLPFDPFMIKQRMPYFLYSLEELRCDLTAFRESVAVQAALGARDEASLSEIERTTLRMAGLVQYAILFDRLFRFPLTGDRVRNYDGLGGQLLFAWLHQRGVLHWTDTRLAFDWDAVPAVVVALSDAINELYWRSIDRPKVAHWLAAHELISATLAPHPASAWARGLDDEVLQGPPKGYTDAVLDDEFPLSMFYEALGKKMAPVIASTKGLH